MNELTVADLIEVHAIGVRDHGGGDPTVPYDAREHMATVLHSAGYNDGVLGYAAAILCYIARAQRFTDGNKRTAWGGCARALEVNGFSVEVGVEEAAAFVLRVVNENLEVEEIAEQLAEWLVELPDPS